MTPEQIRHLAEENAIDTDGEMEVQAINYKMDNEQRDAFRRAFLLQLQDMWGITV
jgi:hypothetical protein